MDVYRIGVNIALANNVSSVLGLISRDLGLLNTKIKAVEGSFGKWAPALAGASAIIGGTMLIGMGKLVQHGRELIHQQQLMKSLAGMSDSEIASATSKAFEISGKVPTSTISDNLRRIRELRGAFGDTPDALKYLEMVSKAQTVLDALTGDRKHGDQVWELVKSGEMKGLTQKPEEFEALMQGMIRGIIAQGGKVTPQDYLSAFKYGRSAMYGWDPEFITQILPSLIQEMKGGGGSGVGGPGNALMSMYSAIVSGQMPKTSAEEFKALGLLNDKDYAPMAGTTMGKISAEGVTGTKEFMHNPYKWIQDVLMPAIEAKYGKDQEKIIAEISRLFRVRTAGAIAIMQGVQGSEFAGANSRLEKDANLARMAMPGGLDATVKELLAHDPTIVMEAFHKQWTAMLEALGSPAVDPAMGVMAKITGVLTSISQFAGEHPEAIKLVLEAVATLVVGLSGLALAALAAALAPLVGTGGLIFGLVAALGALAAFNWKDLTSKLGIDKGGSYSSPGKTGMPAKPMSFNPGNGPVKAQPISLSLNVDGRTLAQAISDQMESLYGFPTGAPASNGVGRYNAGDHNYTDL